MPEGVAPFDAKPLMDKVAERIQTDKYRFAVLGDARHAKTFPALVSYLYETVKPDFLLDTGDMVQAGNGKAGIGYWHKLAKESGDAMRQIPWWQALGNHEMLGGAPPKKTRMEDDEEDDDDQAASGGAAEAANFRRFYNLEREYYSFTFRNAAFIVLPYRYPKGESEEWLERELKKASAARKHIFILNHCPFFTVGNKSKQDIPNEQTSVTQLFARYSVCAVFSGHDHVYYRTVRDGIPYIISAGGGARVYTVTRKREALPADVYYGAAPESEKPKKDADTGKSVTPKKRYVLHNGATGQPDRITADPGQFAVVVDVDGKDVQMFCVTAKGETMDEMVLAK